MGSAQSAFDGSSGGPAVPEGYVTPAFPSLYLPTYIRGREQGGIFLYDAEGIWRFTLYWTLIIFCSTFGLASLIAIFSLSRSLLFQRPTPHSRSRPGTPIISAPSLSLHPLTPLTPLTPHAPSSPLLKDNRRIRPKRKRPPLWPLVLIPIGAVSIAAVTAVISATVIGFALAAVYSAGGFSMSTWVPFLWAVIQMLVVIISSYSTLTKIL